MSILFVASTSVRVNVFKTMRTTKILFRCFSIHISASLPDFMNWILHISVYIVLWELTMVSRSYALKIVVMRRSLNGNRYFNIYIYIYLFRHPILFLVMVKSPDKENCPKNIFLNKYCIVPIAFLHNQTDVFQH